MATDAVPLACQSFKDSPVDAADGGPGDGATSSDDGEDAGPAFCTTVCPTRSSAPISTTATFNTQAKPAPLDA